jgi:hypothetical protein
MESLSKGKAQRHFAQFVSFEYFWKKGKLSIDCCRLHDSGLVRRLKNFQKTRVRWPDLEILWGST